jgi:hypothetical protein
VEKCASLEFVLLNSDDLEKDKVKLGEFGYWKERYYAEKFDANVQSKF